MGKIGDVEIRWNPNPSEASIVKRRGFLGVDGSEPTEIEAVGVESVLIKARAKSNVRFYTIVTDDEGIDVKSEEFLFTMPDGEAPSADSGFSFRVTQWNDEPDPVPNPEPVPTPEPLPEPVPPVDNSL